MVTPPDIETQILRYYHAEKWTVGTIARQLHVHHSVVRRVLAQAGLPRIGAAQRPSPIDAYVPLIQETLAKFPSLIPCWGGRPHGIAKRANVWLSSIKQGAVQVELKRIAVDTS